VLVEVAQYVQGIIVIACGLKSEHLLVQGSGKYKKATWLAGFVSVTLTRPDAMLPASLAFLPASVTVHCD
jgi:hypothetical protein